MQRIIGDTTMWDNLANKGKVQPMSGDITFFDPASTDSFAINSVGEVFPYPIPSNPTPQTFNLKFQVLSVSTASENAGAKYIKEFIIYPYGGIKSVKVHLSD